MDDVLNVGKVKLTGVLASIEKSFWLLKPWSIFSNNGGGVCTISSKDFFLLKHTIKRFDTCHNFKTDARIVVHSEINSKAADGSLLDLEHLFKRVALLVFRN